MPNYSSSNRFELPLTGERSGTWGDMLNAFMGTLLEDAMSGGTTVTMADANYTLVTANAPSQDEARRMVLNIVSSVALSTTRDIIIPNVRKVYSILNSTSGAQSIRIKTATSTNMVTIPNGRRRFLFCDGTDTYDMLTDLPSGVTANGVQVVTLDGSQVLTNKTITAPVITSPTLTVRDNVLTIQDDLDNTKQARFELSSIAPGQTRTITVPDTNLTLVGVDATQTLTNKTLTTPTITVRDNVFTMQDNADATKQALFELSGITTGNTRTMTVADGSFVLGGIPVIGTSVNYNITAADRGDMITCYAGCSTVTFPNAAAVGVNNNFHCRVWNNTGTSITLNATGPSVFIIAGTGSSASITVPHLSQCTVISDGTNWWLDTPVPPDNSVSTAKLINAAVTPAKLSQPFTLDTAQATTSGTFKDFAIPAWAKRARMVLNNVSLSGSAFVRFRLGTSGGLATTGYSTVSSVIGVGAATATQNNGFDIYNNGPSATYAHTGAIDFSLIEAASNTWVGHGVFAAFANTGTFTVAGSISLAGALTTIQIRSSNGTDTFDSGSVNVMYD